MDLIQETAAALCRSRQAHGEQCDAPEAGTCRACKTATETAFRYVPSLECFSCGSRAMCGLTWFSRPVCVECVPNVLCADMMKGDVDGDLARIEKEALEHAGQAGGEYLDSINKFALDRLSEPEWLTFLARVRDGHAASLREAVKRTPPF